MVGAAVVSGIVVVASVDCGVVDGIGVVGEVVVDGVVVRVVVVRVVGSGVVQHISWQVLYILWQPSYNAGQ